MYTLQTFVGPPIRSGRAADFNRPEAPFHQIDLGPTPSETALSDRIGSETDVTVRRNRRVVALRASRAHDELRRRALSRAARPPLRLGRLRRSRDHRPLGADGRAVDEAAPRDPLHRAER